MKRRAALKAAGALATGAAWPATHATAGTARVLRYAFQIAETGFDPAQISDLYSRYVTAHIFDAPLAYDHLARPYKLKPSLAAALPDVSADFRVYTIRFRPGIYFADDPAFRGQRRELVAADFAYSIKRIYDPRWKSPSYSLLAENRIQGLQALRDAALAGQPFDYDRPVAGLQVLDRYTLRVELDVPAPRFNYVLAAPDVWGAVAREVVEFYGDEVMAHPVGTGPFRLAEWRRSSRIVLERNPGYREQFYEAEPNADDADGQAVARRLAGRRLPMLDRVEIYIVEENQPRWLAFLNGEHDLLDRVPLDFANVAIPGGRLAPGLARQGVQMFRVLGADVTLTIYNMDDPVVGGYSPERVALRRALNLALDVPAEIRLVRRGQAVPAQTIVPPHTFGYRPGLRTEMGEHSLTRARALLDLFGYVDRDGDGWREQPDGSPITLEISTQPDQITRQFDELTKKNLAALGIGVRFKVAKWPENLKAVRAGKFMLWSLGSTAASPDGQQSLERAYGKSIGAQNYARFKRGDFDAIYERMKALPDDPSRQALFDEANRIFVAYAPYRVHVHRIITDLAWPWLIGYRRPTVWNRFWEYLDVDPALRPAA
ncbi:MAG: ABC transporter substrate-binding protein [Betaproteobacteria bacterium]